MRRKTQKERLLLSNAHWSPVWCRYLVLQRNSVRDVCAKRFNVAVTAVAERKLSDLQAECSGENSIGHCIGEEEGEGYVEWGEKGDRTKEKNRWVLTWL
uniref:Uncharacterized protein n=1 Tax=Syphacia muris TaxID=451379 RepID=A0A0N5AG35_9BILA